VGGEKVTEKGRGKNERKKKRRIKMKTGKEGEELNIVRTVR